MCNINNLPVLIIAHSRADKFKLCIKKIYGYGIRKIYLSIDGPRHEGDSIQQKLIIDEFYKYSENCELKLNKLDKNYGNRYVVNLALIWLFNLINLINLISNSNRHFLLTYPIKAYL